MKKKIILVIYILLMFFSTNYIFANEPVEDISDSLEVNKYLNVFEDYIKDNNIENISAYEIYSDLITGNGIQYDSIINAIVGNLVNQIKMSAKSVATLFAIVVIIAVVSSLELDSKSEISSISKLIVMVCISGILLKNYLEIIKMFKDIITILSYSMQIVSTFLMGILVATGKITTTGIIEPLLMFVSNFIIVICNYVIIPFFTLSIAINVISKISDNIKLDKLSSIFRKSSLYIFSTAIAIFVLILSMESSVTKSIDNIYFKTTQNIVSDVVPVVGKFLSDSLETVLGATELIGKAGGIVALISIILIVSIPIIKLLVIIALYKILSSFIQPINYDDTISDFIEGFTSVYVDMLGVLIGIMVLFVMITGIIMSMISKIT